MCKNMPNNVLLNYIRHPSLTPKQIWRGRQQMSYHQNYSQLNRATPCCQSAMQHQDKHEIYSTYALMHLPSTLSRKQTTPLLHVVSHTRALSKSACWHAYMQHGKQLGHVNAEGVSAGNIAVEQHKAQGTRYKLTQFAGEF
jgi:hypothetical protein